MAFAKGRTADDLRTDRMLLLALVKEIEILGEAATQISEDFPYGQITHAARVPPGGLGSWNFTVPQAPFTQHYRKRPKSKPIHPRPKTQLT